MGNALTGKWALVTGSTRGLGRTTCRVAGAGGRLDHRQRAGGGAGRRECGGHQGDRRRMRSASRPIWRITPRRIAWRRRRSRPFRKIDILVNNAGMSIRGNFWDVTDDEWDYQVNVNVRSPYILAQHVAKHMIERADRGPDRQHQHDRRACLPQGRGGLQPGQGGRGGDDPQHGLRARAVRHQRQLRRARQHRHPAGHRPSSRGSPTPPGRSPTDGLVTPKTSPPPSGSSACLNPDSRPARRCSSTAPTTVT